MKFWKKQSYRGEHGCQMERKWADVWKWDKVDEKRWKNGKFGDLAIICGKELFEKLNKRKNLLDI